MIEAGSIGIDVEDSSRKYWDRWRGYEQEVLWIDGWDRSRDY